MVWCLGAVDQMTEMGMLIFENLFLDTRIPIPATRQELELDDAHTDLKRP